MIIIKYDTEYSIFIYLFLALILSFYVVLNFDLQGFFFGSVAKYSFGVSLPDH